MSSDIEPVATSQFPVYQPGMDWQTVIESADEILGYDLARDETADDLTGIPFALTSVTFRPGVMRGKVRQAYVSCEVRISPNLDLRMINTRREASRLPRIPDLNALAFGPDSHVVFNDGSTGVYRQVIKYLTAKGYVELKQPVIEAGTYGESSFDQPPSGFKDVHSGTVKFDKDGFAVYATPLAPMLYCPRGLRLSLYENDYTQTGKTRYIG
jgi:hypothetical protein